MKTRVAINGFGRIGRNAFRASLKNKNIEIVAINDIGDPNITTHLLKYDSVYGISEDNIEVKGMGLIVDGHEIQCCQNRNPDELPWKDLKVDIVIESTGFFTSRTSAEKHLKAGAKRVIISAPAKDAIDRTIVMGVNEKDFNAKTDFILSNASCTTNCLAPIAKILHEKLTILKGLMTTIHSYTNDQNLIDNPHSDLRRARAANLSQIPTTTGAAKAVGLVLPELQGKLNGFAIRVPTPTVSIVDLVCETEKTTNKEEVNQFFREAAENELKGILSVSDLPLVSVDFKGNSSSSIVDTELTMVIEGNMIKVFAWYDNEWGYSCRLIDLCEYIGKNG